MTQDSQPKKQSLEAHERDVALGEFQGFAIEEKEDTQLMRWAYGIAIVLHLLVLVLRLLVLRLRGRKPPTLGTEGGNTHLVIGDLEERTFCLAVHTDLGDARDLPVRVGDRGEILEVLDVDRDGGPPARIRVVVRTRLGACPKERR